MDHKPKRILPRFFQLQANLVELLLIGILLSVAVNIITDHIIAPLNFKSFQALIAGSVLALFPIIFVIWRFLHKQKQDRAFNGILIFHVRKNEIVEIPRYHFGSKVKEYLQDGLAQNPRLRKFWNQEPSSLCEIPGSEKLKLMAEASEYYVLSELSGHLSEYFSGDAFKGERLSEYKREDLGHITADNRLLDLFSTPPDRLIHNAKKVYEPFVLQLPQGSTIRKKTKSGFEIETKRMRIGFVVTLQNRKSDLSADFRRMYLGLDEMTRSETHALEVRVVVAVSFKLPAFLSPTGWHYYQWIDSFLDELESKLSETAFLDQIGWERASIIIDSTTKYAQREERRFIKLREYRRTYLRTNVLTDWILEYHKYQERVNGIPNSLWHLELDERYGPAKRIPFLSRPEWNTWRKPNGNPTNLLKIQRGWNTILVPDNSARTDFEVNYELIHDRESIDQSLWDAPTLYLDSIEGSVTEGTIRFGVKVCRYYASATCAIRLENETIEGVRFHQFDFCPIREQHLLTVENSQDHLYKPMTLGCMIVFALKTDDGYDIILQVRSDKNATANSVTSIAPNFGLSPFLERPPDYSGLLHYNFLKEYLEEFFDRKEFVREFHDALSPETQKRHYDLIYNSPEVEPLLGDDFNLYYLGFGFNLINGFPNIGLLAKLDNTDSAKFIKDCLEPNWEVATGFTFVNCKDSARLKEVFGRIEPAGGFFLASALNHLR